MEPREPELRAGSGEHMRQWGQDPREQKGSMLLLSDAEVTIERGTGFGDVGFGSQQLTHHEFQNLHLEHRK